MVLLQRGLGLVINVYCKLKGNDEESKKAEQHDMLKEDKNVFW